MPTETITIAPYQWQGPYAQWRSDALHDPSLCADLRAPWMPPGERIIVRSCEMIGEPTSFLYDDHTPPAEAATRGKNYVHTSFQWDTSSAPRQLSADCTVPDRARFALTLRGETDYVDIHLTLQNLTDKPLGPIDWAFCPISLECPSLRDPDHQRTFIYDGSQLRALADLDDISHFNIYAVAGAHGFRPEVHKTLHPGSIEAQASVIILEGPHAQHSAALGFPQSNDCFGCRGNMCFHADPYFGTLDPHQQKTIPGRLYLIPGNAQQAFQRYQNDFPNPKL